MTTPKKTIEAITYDGSNSHEILLWLQLHDNAFVTSKAAIGIKTAKGWKKVKPGGTIIKLGDGGFTIIDQPIVTY